MKAARKVCAIALFALVGLLPIISVGQSRKNIPRGDTFIIETPSGEIRVKNFFKQYPMIKGEFIKDVIVNLPDGMQYNGTTKTFSITVMMSGTSLVEFRKKREELQNELLSILGISRSEACKLKVEVAAVNRYANFGPEFYQSSFCSGNAVIPRGRSQQPAIGEASALPSAIQSYLNKNYIGWKLNSVATGCYPEFKRAVLIGDYDGDGKRDYVVKIIKRSKGYYLAFLDRKTDFEAHVLLSMSVSEIKNTGMSIGRKGERYPIGDIEDGRYGRLPNDAPLIGTCESEAGYYIYRNGRFQ